VNISHAVVALLSMPKPVLGREDQGDFATVDVFGGTPEIGT
jgi:hypothetical protein